MKVSKKIIIIDIIIIIGLIIGICTVIIKQSMNINVKPLLSDMTQFSDFIDILKYTANKNSVDIIGNYFPFAYIIMSFLQIISFGSYEIIYLITVIIALLICIIISKETMDESRKNFSMWILAIILVVFQFPMLFCIQRGNIESIGLALCIVFYYFYKKEKYNMAAIFLSLAVCIKLYPALLALLFIGKKQYKSLFLCAGMSVVLTILSYVIMSNLLGNLPEYMQEFGLFLDRYGKGLEGMQYNHSILFGIYYMLNIFFGNDLQEILSGNIINVYTPCIIAIAIPLIIYTIFSKIRIWKKITLFVLMMVSFPQVSFDYTLIMLIIPIIEFVSDKETKKWEDIVYAILFGMLLIPMNIGETILASSITMNAGLIVRPAIIIAMIIIIMISDVKKKVGENESLRLYSKISN